MNTRERLLHVASELFVERGYHGVTVRDISQRAEANLAAVGYHFGDKLNLYRAVIESAFERVRQEGGELQLGAAELSPEDKLRFFVHSYLSKIVRPGAHVDWFQRLMRHELDHPSPIARELSERIFRPRMQYLGDLVAQMLGTSIADARVRLSVFSIHAQCMFYLRENVRNLLFRDASVQTPEEIRLAAEHIADFSIAGIHGLGRAPKKPAPARRRARG